MKRLLYIVRLNLGILILSLGLVLRGHHGRNQDTKLDLAPFGRGLASQGDLACADAMAAIIRDGQDFTPRGQALQDSISDYEQKMAEMEGLIFTPKSFAQDYYRQHGVAPTLKEIVEKIILGHQELVRKINDLKAGNPKVKYFVDETVKALNFSDKHKEKIQDFIRENKALLNKRINIGKARTAEEKELKQKLELIWKNPYGDFGELKAALHFQGVEAQNLHLRLYKVQAVGPQVEFHQNKIVEATTSAIESLENASDETMARFKERFPRVFADNRAEDLEAIKQWLESKEVDLITKSEQGRFYFIEVKNYQSLVNKDSLYEGHRGKKSVFEQQLEMKEILEFLELDSTYSPAITFLKGIDDEARQVLEEAGIMVIDYP